ncbi:MerR family transcriptional regulator [Hungatella effluvii]|uniref:MerR family transcriptional regulator n=1 Tax=Hungatella effluvii TaxID=1096246 RepID=UPI002A82A553|nr:effector binding domain-containing protein [Hungatella effluvii]
MELMTVSQVSRSLGISTRMLRYYEQAGLVESLRQEGYAYRIYDEKAVLRLKQILLLRRLRIPVRQIKAILLKEDAVAAIEIFRENIRNLNEEMTALSVVKEILNHFVEELSRTAELPLEKILLKDDVLADSIESLGLISINFKEDQTMEKLKKAEAGLSRIGDVRIIYLPPSAVAAAHYVGDEPEIHVNEMLDRFVRETGLHRRKPDLRHYGFNHPNPTDATGFHGYDSWVTIPEDMEVPAPLVKKLFVGGIYAAHMISFGSFNEWDLLLNWVNSNEKYEFAGDMADQEHMCGLLEEHLNYISHVELANTEPEEFQLDLLVPVRERKI